MNWTEEKINQIITDIKKRASEDEAYRQLCLDNPHEAIKQVSGMEVLEGVKINIIENEPGMDHTIILPPEPGTTTNEALDQIAGGKDTNHPCAWKVYPHCGALHCYQVT